MTRNQAWARAYREQASADLAALSMLARNALAPASVVAMLLQMVLEKAMKSALLGFDPGTSPESIASGHRAFDRVIRTALLNRTARVSRIILRDRWRSRSQLNKDPLFKFLQILDSASPSSVARTAQAAGLNRLAQACLEYPWENLERRTCHWPEQSHELSLLIKDPVGSPLKHAFHYLQYLLNELDSALPKDAPWS